MTGSRTEVQLRLDVSRLTRELDQALTTAELARDGQRQAEAQLRVLESRVEDLLAVRDGLANRAVEAEARLRDAMGSVAQAVTMDVRPVPSTGHQDAVRLRGHLRRVLQAMAAWANSDEEDEDHLQAALDAAVAAATLELSGVPVEVVDSPTGRTTTEADDGVE